METNASTFDLKLKSVQRPAKKLKEIDTELAYLALLTWAGVKPLSRWERPLEPQATDLLGDMDLLAQRIRRTVKTGREVIETVFSRNPAYVQVYRGRFADAPIDKSAHTLRLEGFLFGYPPCCVEQYIRQPYAPNNLPEESQRILFHWACKDCRITPLLVPAYQQIHDYIAAV